MGRVGDEFFGILLVFTMRFDDVAASIGTQVVAAELQAGLCCVWVDLRRG